MIIPESNLIDVAKLNTVFNNTTATYKYYWFLAILEASNFEGRIIKKRIFAGMVAHAWYTVQYFQLKFGPHDLLHDAIKTIQNYFGENNIPIDARKDDIIDLLMNTESKEINKILNHFNANVPHKFLSPWLGSGSLSTIYSMSQSNYCLPPYALYKDEILIQPNWLNYFKNNQGILKAYTFWNLAKFLQVRNPNVPDIIDKLERPILRKNLNAHKLKFWDIYLKESIEENCIYNGNKLSIGNYAVEHFIPHQFVAHDLMWNLVPADPIFNSIKGSKLPPLEIYFDKFYNLQKGAVNFFKEKDSKNIFLEDYIMIFSDLNFEKQQFLEIVQPIWTIARNNGFKILSK
jgi:hypothetical protein